MNWFHDCVFFLGHTYLNSFNFEFYTSRLLVNNLAIIVRSIYLLVMVKTHKPPKTENLPIRCLKYIQRFTAESFKAAGFRY